MTTTSLVYLALIVVFGFTALTVYRMAVRTRSYWLWAAMVTASAAALMFLAALIGVDTLIAPTELLVFAKLLPAGLCIICLMTYANSRPDVDDDIEGEERRTVR